MATIIGKRVLITTNDSDEYDQWGIVKLFDGDSYHIAIANSSTTSKVFDRNEFRVIRDWNK